MPKKTKPKKRTRPLAKRSRAITAASPADYFPPAGTGGGILGEGLSQLARTTDAVVDRVANSARDQGRDPGDHLLDLSKAYYREESATGQHSVQCDRCLLKSPGTASVRAASKLAESLGWVVTDSFDHCPVCKDGSKLLAGGSTALAVPPRLTHAELILVVRLRYIGDKIASGASVEALLQNSVRSQHRPMLSDLAQETNYDSLPLVEKVAQLLSKNADLPAVYRDDAPKAWAFLLRLYELLKTEDQGPT